MYFFHIFDDYVHKLLYLQDVAWLYIGWAFEHDLGELPDLRIKY